jgi:PPK2 family polyphosphate:nucleotide phosphotransferase
MGASLGRPIHIADFSVVLRSHHATLAVAGKCAIRATRKGPRGPYVQSCRETFVSKRAVHDAKRMREILERYRVTSGKGFDLDAHKPDDLPHDLPDKQAAKALLKAGTARMAELQDKLYANGTWSVLLVFQAMDAGGKDSTIKHVMSGVNPQGVVVTSFKAPGPHELAHDFLWRVHRAAPARGMIGIFNRSHYEEVLVTRVHHQLLEAAHMPQELIDRDGFWGDRIADIAAFEAYLARQGTRIVKFFLDVSRDEQKERFLSRLDTPDKTWKFSAADVKERAFWPKYRKAYQAAIAGTATKETPWYIVPADRKWYMRLVVAEAIVAALEDLDLKMPEVSDETRAALADVRDTLAAE